MRSKHHCLCCKMLLLFSLSNTVNGKVTHILWMSFPLYTSTLTLPVVYPFLPNGNFIKAFMTHWTFFISLAVKLRLVFCLFLAEVQVHHFLFFSTLVCLVRMQVSFSVSKNAAVCFVCFGTVFICIFLAFSSTFFLCDELVNLSLLTLLFSSFQSLVLTMVKWIQ